MHRFFRVLLAMSMVLTAAAASFAQQKKSPAQDLAGDDGYVIEQPGTITFKSGITIVGKVEKPQVMIVLLKEKATYKDMAFTHSFMPEMMQPLPFTPIAP